MAAAQLAALRPSLPATWHRPRRQSPPPASARLASDADGSKEATADPTTGRRRPAMAALAAAPAAALAACFGSLPLGEGPRLAAKFALSATRFRVLIVGLGLVFRKRQTAFVKVLEAYDLFLICCLTLIYTALGVEAPGQAPPRPRPNFVELEDGNGVKVLNILEGTGRSPQAGDKVAIHYYGRLAAKQGWRFDSTYEHLKDGTPEPFSFTVGSGDVIAGLDAAVRSMREGGIRRVIIPPSQGYQTTHDQPLPPNFSDRQRLFTTIFNPTRIANGEGATLGIVIFDIELLKIRPT
eukprot:SM000114S24128  [mRNA]  locus=s114:112673:114439:+ [translate_table: standard]